MSHYAKYCHLLNRPYTEGRFDCYGLVRDYCLQVWGVELTNFARPQRWWDYEDFDLLSKFLETDGWENLGVSTGSLRQGDGLVFSVCGDKANHCGIYVGNGLFIHHLYRQVSKEESLSSSWKRRILSVVRHPGISPEERILKLEDVLPDDIKRRIAKKDDVRRSRTVRLD